MNKTAMSDIFEINRFILLLRSNVVSNYRGWLTNSVALSGVILLTALVSGGFSSSFYGNWFGIVLVVFGLLLSGRSFQELHDKTRNDAFLLIPASSIEKTLAKLLIATIGFVAYLLIFMSVISVVIEVLKLGLFGVRNPFFNPFDDRVWELIRSYLFVQSFFFLGAAWYRKSQIAKTTVAINVALIGFSVFGIMVIRVIFSSYFTDGFDVGLVASTLLDLYDGPITVALNTCAILIPIACWAIAWLRVRETQVSDGV